jgi:hypothetical protein
MRWLPDDVNVFIGEELLHNMQCVALWVIVMQKPLSLKPLPLNWIGKPLQNLHIDTTSNTLSTRYEITAQQTVDVTEFRELFDSLRIGGKPALHNLGTS